MKKGFWVVIIIVLIILAGLGYYLFSKNRQKNPSNNTPAENDISNVQDPACDQGIEKIKLREEVVEYLKQVPQAKFECNSQEDGSILVHVYEIVQEEGDLPSHTATMGWYMIKPDGSIENYM
jgi:hypothetical protein